MRVTSLLLTLALATVAAAQQPAAKPPVKPPAEDYPLDLVKIGVAMPETSDPELLRLLTSPRTIFYKLPQAWQHYIPASKIERNNLTTGVKSYFMTEATWGLYAPTVLPEFNANALFPWETTIGLNSSHKESNFSYRTINLLNLPDDKLGGQVPILVLGEYPIKWIYPAGTTLGEVIYVIHDGKKYVQEIRTRTKSADSKEWTPHLYRPIKNRAEFEELSGLKGYVPAQKYMFFRNPQEDEVFKMEGLVERLPPVPAETVKRLLKRPFKETTDDAWSPSADQDFHILPRNYCFSLLKGVDSHTCASCHQQTQISVLNLTPREPLIIDNPAKVGNIRGSDGGFTWHPFDPKCIRMSEQEPELKIALRPYDFEHKVVKVLQYGEPYKGSEHKLTQYVQDSLKPYELPAKQFLHATSP